MKNETIPLPDHTGKYFAIFRREPVILIIEETYMEVIFDCGQTDMIYYDELEDLEWWIDVDKVKD